MRRHRSPRHTTRGLALATIAAALLAVTAGPAAARGQGSSATIDVSSGDCVSVRVSSTKSISNVVLRFADSGTQRFEDLPESRTGTFAGTGDAAGETVTTVWVKSGNNPSGDGPGYGERFDLSCTPDDPKDPKEPKDPKDPKEPEDPKDPKDPKDPDDGDDPTDVPPPPRDINDPVDEPPVQQDDGGDDFDEEVLNAVEENDPRDQAPQVLGVQEVNDDGTVVAAAASLPAAGLESWVTTLFAALASFALGGTLLRRTRRSGA